MLLQHRWLLAALVLSGALACNSTSGCGGFTSVRPGTYTGSKIDTAGAFQLSAKGYTALNTNSGALLELLAPGGKLDTKVDCQVQSAGLLGTFAVGDQGSAGCTDPSCGRGDGKCDAQDLAQPIPISVTALSLGANTPDLVEAKLTATVQTGLLIVSSTNRNHALCLFSGGGPITCSLDFDSTRQPPTTNVIDVEIKLGLRNGLLSLELSELRGTKACGSSGAGSMPECIDPNDIVIANAGGCSGVCDAANSATVKQLLIDQLTKSLKTQLEKSLKKLTCQACGNQPSDGLCPTNAECVIDTSTDAGTGTCIETVGGLCSPRFLGLEGRADLGSLLGNYGVAPNAALDVSLALGGATTSAPAQGSTVGMRGGAQEVTIAPCVSPLTPTAWPNLPLPDFSVEGPGSYDFALSVSQQMLSEALYRAQQSGALCLELGSATVAQLDSATLQAFLPSLKAVTHNQNVPMRVVMRPVHPPTAIVGKGTFDASGKPVEPLITLSWLGLEIDVYALVEDRQVRLFTIAADLALPLGLKVANCHSVQPVVGDVTNAISNATVKNAELLAESDADIAKLVPTLLNLATPALASGLPSVEIPALTGVPFQLQLVDTRGVGAISGTSQYNHIGLYGTLAPVDAGCP